MLGEYQGRPVVNVRIWYVERDGDEPKPGKGFALSLEAFEAFVETVNAAHAKIRSATGAIPVSALAGATAER